MPRDRQEPAAKRAARRVKLLGFVPAAQFVRVFGDASVRRAWFNQLIQSALVATVTGAYAEFGVIAGAALEMTAARRDIVLAAADRAQILGGIRDLPPHPVVQWLFAHQLPNFVVNAVRDKATSAASRANVQCACGWLWIKASVWPTCGSFSALIQPMSPSLFAFVKARMAWMKRSSDNRAITVSAPARFALASDSTYSMVGPEATE
jgi:hypothetical protein